MYELLDREERELVVYHWHPKGVSTVRSPHLHFAGAPPLVLPPGPGEQQSHQLAINRAHFPTGRIAIEAFIELLIRDFGIEPKRSDWQAALDAGVAKPWPGGVWE